VNECNNLFIILTNATQLGASGIQVTLSSPTPGVGFGTRTVNYPDLPPATAATNLVPFTLSTAPEFLCGTPITLDVLIKSDQATVTNTLVLPTGTPGAPLRFHSVLPIPIPDNNPAGTNSFILVTNVTTAVRKVTVSLHITHSYDSDLRLELIAPDGTAVTLSDSRGGSGDNYGTSCTPETARTTFDDEASTPIGNGVPPFAGAFKPEQPLALLAGKFGTNVNGLWRLRVVDLAPLDVGTLRCWSLSLSPAECTDGGGTCPGVDLALGIRDNPDPVFVGSNLVYTITVTNFGPSAATNVVVHLPLPPTVVFVSANASQGTVSDVAGTVVANLGQIPFAGRATVNVTVRPLVTGLLSATATVSSKDPDLNSSDNSATATTTVTPPAAELAVGLADAPDPTIVGAPLTYTVSVTNNGPAVATGVTVTNVLPVTVNIVAVTPSQGTVSIFGNTVAWNAGALPVGAAATATIRVTPTAPGTLVATASARALQADPLPANNSATATTTVGPAADLVVTFTDAPDPVVIGSNWVYTATVTNLGPNTASSAVLNITLPSGVRIVSSNATLGTLALSGNTLIGTLGTLAPGSGAVVTVTVNSTNAGVFNASATAAAAQADPNLADNTANQTTTVAAPFVSIVAAGATLTAESFAPPNGSVDVGETVTVTLRLRNAGNVPNTNLTATLLATNGVTAPSGSQNYGVLPAAGLPVGRSFTFTAAGTNGGTVIATLQLQDGPNNLGTVTFTFALPRVHTFANTNPIAIPDAGPASPYPSTITVSGVTGTVGRVTVTLSNLTHTFAEDLDMLLAGPTGQKAVIFSDAGNPFGVANLTVTLDDAAAAPLPDNGQILSGAFRPADYEPGDPFNPPAPAAPYANTLSVFANQNPNGLWALYVMDDTPGDAGSIAGGWRLSIYTITPVNQLADVALSASAAPNLVMLGDPVTFTFTVTNLGPNPATGLAFTNVLPASLTLLSASASQGTTTTNANTVLVNLGSLNPSASATVTVVARPNLHGPITNTATAGASENDLNPANNTASALTTVRLPWADLTLAKLADAEVVLGSNVNFTIGVTNLGPEIALNVTVSDPLPAGLSFVSALSTLGTVATNGGSNVVAALGNLAPNEGALITIKATANALGWITNVASAATASADTNAANNAATALTRVVPPAPRIVAAGARILAETLTNAALDIGETVTLALSLQNVGSADATNLVATLLAANGVTAPSGPQTYGLVAAGGAPVARPFTFTTAGTNGGIVIATLQLHDGTNDLGTVSFAFNLPGRGTFANTNAISIPDHGVASPYPSTIWVSGLTGLVSRVTVRLHGLTHAFPDDLDLLLVGPAGQKLVIMSDAGGGRPVTNVTVTLDDAAAAPLPDSGQILPGNHQPADYESGDTFPSPAPSGATGGPLSFFNGSDPNGLWALYVVDDAIGDPGGINGGWSLTIETLSTINPVADLAVSVSDAPDPLYVGSGLDYTVVVTNLGPSAATGVTVTNVLPTGMAYVSGAASQGSIGAAGNLVTANLGDLAVGAGATVTFRVATAIGGVHVNTVGVLANETDLNPANNVAQTATTVQVPLPARLDDVTVTNGQVQATLSGEPGQTYVIEASTNLLNWTPLVTNTLPGSGTAKFNDLTAPAFGHRFYRAVRLIP
ncbi:MAG: proprotein convertase P-domain-containing protein, partial [Verrucomicrobiae bacterium]|nr:proprotein convertase P-domain-containing protein [Verrucomicrobiae bacterium]